MTDIVSWVKAAEIDYIISNGIRIIPIEVKAGKSGTLRSLHYFLQDKSCKLGVRFNINCFHCRYILLINLNGCFLIKYV